jgi:hypothetical protein
MKAKVEQLWFCQNATSSKYLTYISYENANIILCDKTD